jgi:p21-activated kinase 1
MIREKERERQEKNPQTVMDIVKFYQEEHDLHDPWDKLGYVSGPTVDRLDDFANPVCLSPHFLN